MSQFDLPIRTKEEQTPPATPTREPSPPPIPIKQVFKPLVRRDHYAPSKRNGTPLQPREEGPLHQREAPSEAGGWSASENLAQAREAYKIKNPTKPIKCEPWQEPARSEYSHDLSLYSPYRLRTIFRKGRVGRFERKHGMKGVSKEESDALFKAEDDWIKSDREVTRLGRPN